MFKQIGWLEITLVILLVVLLFGAKKLPDLARGVGRSLRIFKSETKGLADDDDAAATTSATQATALPPASAQAPAVSPVAPAAPATPAPASTDRTDA